MSDMSQACEKHLNFETTLAIRNHFLSYLANNDGIEHFRNGSERSIAIGSYRNLKCQHPHNKIYGMLELSHLKDAVELSYDCPALEVFCDLALVYLQ